MKISFIVPLYYGKKYIDSIIGCVSAAVEDARINNDTSIEIVFVNDMPEEEIAASDYSSPSVEIAVICNDSNKGIHYSRVRGLKNATGEYVVFLDQDDTVDKHYITSQLAIIGDADVAIANGIYRNDYLIMSDEKAYAKVTDRYYYFSGLDGIVSPGQALIRKDRIPKEWSNNILKCNYCDDAYLWLLLKSVGGKFVVNNEVLYRHNEGGANTSFRWDKNAEALEELKSVILSSNTFSEYEKELLNKGLGTKIAKHTSYAKVEKIFQNIESGLVDEVKKKTLNKIISIYGFGVFGRRLYYLFKNNGINVEFVIDRNISVDESQVKMVKKGEMIPSCDLMIITPVMEYETIKQELEHKTNAELISLLELGNA